jgi:hypothetical protein
LHQPGGALIGGQSIAVHLLEQRLFFGCKIKALARQRSPYTRSAATDLGNLGTGKSASTGHKLSSNGIIITESHLCATTNSLNRSLMLYGIG